MSAITARRRPDSHWEYRLLFAFTFPLFLGGAMLRRMRGPQGASLFRDARGRAAAVLPFAFRG
ncbi:MAG: hypothetical protein INR64_15260 [Caulobacteraceae bacterium]|nr:hypothetical protein [Caulobacter sp.]